MSKILEKQDEKGAPDFLRIAFEEYVFAMLKGKHLDSEYVKKEAYKRYEEESRADKEARKTKITATGEPGSKEAPAPPIIA